MSPRRCARPCLLALLCAVGFTLQAGGPAQAAASATTPAKALAQDIYPAADYPGLQHRHYSYGPVHLTPGQNLIQLGGIGASGRPTVPGYITAFRPNLTYLDGTVPGVDVVHLHHGVWLVDGERRWASGEEKTYADLPQGFGWRYDPGQSWVMNHMIHNLYPNEADVLITWDIDFVPDSSPAAAAIKPVTTKWMDVSGPSAYPVFDAKRKKGRRTFTFPDDAGPDPVGLGPEHEWKVERDQTVVWSAGHLHPGGLHTDLTVTRDGRTVPLFRSVAKYWEPAGPVSWDVAMTATHPGWKVELRKGDLVKVSGTYDVSRASWYESMAIMFLETYAGTDVGGVDPFVRRPSTPGRLTHGHRAENANHGGGKTGLPDARAMLSGRPVGGPLAVAEFLAARGDLNRLGRAVPTIKRGGRLTFVNKDASTDTFHTITACRAPCNRSTGIAYPLADGPVDFDSGELGFGPRGLTAAANRDRWSTPKTLPTGTYTYFCRVHPFMRGAFRVVS
jgi:plastocyanin